MVDLKTEKIAVNTGVTLEFLSAGKGPLILFLHGFPEMAYSWKAQLERFASKGYRAVAPNLRGYGGSDKPKDGYDLDTLAADIAGLIEALGESSAIVAGHDWGGIVAWHLATQRPDKVKALVIMNAPHPVRYDELLHESAAMRRKAAYVLAFQLPFLPEWFLGRNGAKYIGDVIYESAVRKAPFTPAALKRYRDNMAIPGALKAGLAYYRATVRNRRATLDRYVGKKIQSPTLVLWATGDKFLDAELAEGLERFVDAPLLVKYIENCGHWVQQEAPEEVNAAMEDFLAKLGSTNGSAN